MNKNYTKLEKFPMDIINPALEQWKTQKEQILEFLEKCDYGVTQQEDFPKDLNLTCFNNFRKYDDKLFHLQVKKSSLLTPITAESLRGISFFISKPGKIDSFHIDTERCCAINFPIEVDTNTSAFRIGRNDDLDSYNFSSGNIKEWQHKYYDKKGKGTYNLLDEEYESYGLDQAIIFNSKIPHGGANFGDDIRVIGSIGFSDPYDQMLEFFEDWI